jgi:hypothetical protein
LKGVESCQVRVSAGWARREISHEAMEGVRWHPPVPFRIDGHRGQQNAGAVTYSNNRIAIDADGNHNDTDDCGATPIELALLARRGLQAKLVHYDWANIIGPTIRIFTTK